VSVCVCLCVCVCVSVCLCVCVSVYLCVSYTSVCQKFSTLSSTVDGKSTLVMLVEKLVEW
jgi:hypothetical protein